MNRTEESRQQDYDWCIVNAKRCGQSAGWLIEDAIDAKHDRDFYYLQSEAIRHARVAASFAHSSLRYTA